MVNNTIAKDLEDINKKVKAASLGLRKERVRLIKIKAKEITGEDIELEAADIDTDVNVEVNLNDLARTEGIVSIISRINIFFGICMLSMVTILLSPGPKPFGHPHASTACCHQLHLG